LSIRSRLVRLAYDHRRALKALLPVHRSVLVRLDGFAMFVRLDDWAVGARIALRRRHEPHVVAVFGRHLRPGAVVVDVGANAGYYSLFAASRVGPGGRVYAFEPGVSSCELLRQSAVHNRFSNIEVHECAASDVEGLVGFGMDDSNGRISHERVDASPLRVRAVTLDRALAAVPRVDVVKIDVEGAEARVLRGMRGIVERDHPALFAEFSPAGLRLASGVEPARFLDELRGHGYALQMIPRAGPLSPPASNDEILAAVSSEGTEHHLDLLAIPPGAAIDRA